MKHLLFILGTMTLIAGCKDVEKNPSNCGYDYIKEGDKCVHVDNRAKEIRTANKTEIHGDITTRKYFEIDEQGYYTLNFKSVDKIEKDQKAFESYMNEREVLLAMKAKVEGKTEVLRNLNNRNYSYTAQQEVYSLESLDEEIDRLTIVKGDLRVIYDLSEEDRADAIKYLNRLEELMEGDSDTNYLGVNIKSRYNQVEGVDVGLPSNIAHYTIRNLRKIIALSLSERMECSLSLDLCVSDLKRDAEYYTPALYETLIKDISDSDYP